MLSNENKIGWSLAKCLRIHGVTIRELANHTGLTMKRIREVKAMKFVGEFTAFEYVDAVKRTAAARKSVLDGGGKMKGFERMEQRRREALERAPLTSAQRKQASAARAAGMGKAISEP